MGAYGLAVFRYMPPHLLYICIYAYACTHTYTHAHIYIYIYIHAHQHVRGKCMFASRHTRFK